MKKRNANTEYKATRKSIKVQLGIIKNYLDLMDAKQKEKPDWGFTGSLNHVHHDLIEIINFLQETTKN